jgi:hypothetical protein
VSATSDELADLLGGDNTSNDDDLGDLLGVSSTDKDELKPLIPSASGPDEHAALPPSDSKRWRNCPAALWMSKHFGKKDSETEYTAEGTMAHAVMYTCLVNGWDVIKGREIPVEINGEEQVVTVTDEMEQLLDPIVHTIRELYKGAKVIHYESRIDVSSIYGVADQFGTADAWAYFADTKTLRVDDLKYGRVCVDAVENDQMIIYAAGVAVVLVREGYPVHEIILGIHQPRNGGSREWHTDTVYLDKQIDKLHVEAPAAHHCLLSEAPPPPEAFNPDPDVQCKYCDAKLECDAFKQHITNMTRMSFDDVSSVQAAAAELKSRPVEELAQIYRACSAIESYCKNVRAVVSEKALSGEKVPGIKVVRGKAGNKAWKSEEEAEKVLKSMKLKQNEMYKMALETPTQIIKVLKEAKSNRKLKRLQDYIEQPMGKLTIAVEEDPREAISMDVSEQFDVIEDQTEGDDDLAALLG